MAQIERGGQSSSNLAQLGTVVICVCVSSLSAHDLIDECGQVGPLEGLLEAGHLVDDAAQRPDVRLLVVHLALAHLGAD